MLDPLIWKQNFPYQQNMTNQGVKHNFQIACGKLLMSRDIFSHQEDNLSNCLNFWGWLKVIWLLPGLQLSSLWSLSLKVQHKFFSQPVVVQNFNFPNLGIKSSSSICCFSHLNYTNQLLVNNDQRNCFFSSENEYFNLMWLNTSENWQVTLSARLWL